MSVLGRQVKLAIICFFGALYGLKNTVKIFGFPWQTFFNSNFYCMPMQIHTKRVYLIIKAGGYLINLKGNSWMSRSWKSFLDVLIFKINALVTVYTSFYLESKYFITLSLFLKAVQFVNMFTTCCAKYSTFLFQINSLSQGRCPLSFLFCGRHCLQVCVSWLVDVCLQLWLLSAFGNLCILTYSTYFCGGYLPLC